MSDRKLLAVAKSFRKGILGKGSSCLMCMAVSLPLQGWLSALGVETNLELVNLDWCNHAFLRLPDGRVLDPTADQFGDLKTVQSLMRVMGEKNRLVDLLENELREPANAKSTARVRVRIGAESGMPVR